MQYLKRNAKVEAIRWWLGHYYPGGMACCRFR
ncbi:hypothetical protein BamMEX5DRAFT_6801 [Burkholderia ambifaria MEX-5]|uniref:Uncharacterized protein n=1 Tax=Burkholderia ambifaria MEX-5 TaxID=396597 RepID=B1TG85_9BURK|nr:hypothetical protein BamMEX5DRAFT_6801 [Burkholderia ambifaria MEX-5]